MLLEKCDGPACPRCGCCDSEVLALPPAKAPLVSKAQLEARQFYGVSHWFSGGKARCKHCGLRFSFRELPPAEEDPPEVDTTERDTKPDPDPLAGLAFLDESPTRTPPAVPQGMPLAAEPTCPACGSREVKVTSSRKTLRHYRCPCGSRFKLPREG